MFPDQSKIYDVTYNPNTPLFFTNESDVFKGKHRGKDVAVKRLRLSDQSRQVRSYNCGKAPADWLLISISYVKC
jgi:hypothetical protein